MYISQYAFYPFATLVCCGSLKAIDWFTLQIYIYFLKNKQFSIIFSKNFHIVYLTPVLASNCRKLTSRAHTYYILYAIR